MNGTEHRFGVLILKSGRVYLNQRANRFVGHVDHFREFTLKVVRKRRLNEVASGEFSCVEVNFGSVANVTNSHGQLVHGLVDELSKAGSVCQLLPSCLST